jgi:hypothetical protein
MGDHSTSKKPVPKVLAATGGSVVGSSAALITLVSDAPEWVQVLVIIFGPPVLGFLSGYAARKDPNQ